MTALTPDMVEVAPRLADEWERVMQAFAGRYILSFNLEFDQSKLRENAECYSLIPITIIGACLMEASRTYFRRSAYPRLATVCAQIGFPLPDHPDQDAFDRVRGQIHLLETMAQWMTNVPEPEQDTHQDEDPFFPDE